MPWTCTRQTAGVRCRERNDNRRTICVACGKRRPPRQRPAHLSALAYSYDWYVELNGGETCGICGTGPKPGRRLDRDHSHEGVGVPRGLLCHYCNRTLKQRITPEWLRAAAAYLERVEERRA
jgi:hypothetical protein